MARNEDGGQYQKAEILSLSQSGKRKLRNFNGYDNILDAARLLYDAVETLSHWVPVKIQDDGQVSGCEHNQLLI